MASAGAGTSLVDSKVSPPVVLPRSAFTTPAPTAAAVPIARLRTLYVYFCDGRIEAIDLCNRMDLNDSNVIVRLGDGSTRKFRRADVYFASWGQVTPPVMF
jgi:hypothetical protein